MVASQKDKEWEDIKRGRGSTGEGGGTELEQLPRERQRIFRQLSTLGKGLPGGNGHDAVV